MDAIGAWLEFALRSWMSSSTNAGSPSAWRDEIALEAEPRLTLRIAGASDLVNVLGVGGLEALLQYARVPSGTPAAAAGAVLPSSGGEGRNLLSFASIDSRTDGSCMGMCLRWQERFGDISCRDPWCRR